MRLPLLFLLLLIDTVLSSNIFTLTQQQHTQYSQWKSNYGKSYQSGEVEAYRLTLWVQNYNRIEMHNAKYRDGTASYFLAPNHLSDLPLEEIENMLFYNSMDAYDIEPTVDTPPDSPEGDIFAPPDRVDSICSLAEFHSVPELSMQHFYQGAQFNQISPTGVCANGWAIAIAQTVSVSLSNLARKNKKPQIIISLSPQQLTDCALPTGSSDGCSMGSLYHSWKYYINFGAVANSQYLMTNSAKECDETVTRTRSFSIPSCSIVAPQNEFQLRKAVSVTPVVVQINAKAYGFIFYGGGIYDAADCSQEVYQPNHALTVIGYDYQIDFDEEGVLQTTKYWQMMNSLGAGWGENGYMRIVRSQGETGPGPCGMYKSPTFPVL